ncbi:hypothetical protein HANVADRAFT_51384 [Hanseniaspora valbyensis NRRL Y-1626]|uniref:Uncharacterized protein n=1 Tax=Hanseniaspora valbyensis NRRL Y-1626 TaxID=766949 RepID=A0A1B7TIA1_9ASCO|nr:hypothetical protein HANVADRAFT_51384 [Hanseniaspora valbyensis NRRL Y-1626]
MNKESKKELKRNKIKQNLLRYINLEDDIHHDEDNDYNISTSNYKTSTLKVKKTNLLTLKRSRSESLIKQRKTKLQNKTTLKNNNISHTETYGKEDWESYRSQFQRSYEKSSQIYYDAIDSPSKIAEIYTISSCSDNNSNDEEMNKNIDDAHMVDSSGDEMMPTSQHDFEIIKVRKKKHLLDEIYHTDLDSKLRLENNVSQELRNSPVIPLTLSQICEPSNDKEKDNDHSIITFSDDDNVVVESFQSSKIAKNSMDNDNNDSSLPYCFDNSEEDSDCIILPDSQINSPVKSNEDEIKLTQESYRAVSLPSFKTENTELEEIPATRHKHSSAKNDLHNISLLDECQSDSFISDISYFVTKLERSPELQKIIVSPVKDTTPNESNDNKNPTTLKLNLINALNYESHIDFFENLNEIINNFKKDEDKMSKILANNIIKDFFLNISIGKPWKFTDFREVLIVVIKNIFEINTNDKNDIELNKIISTIQLIDQELLREWGEDELGACFEMLR